MTNIAFDSIDDYRDLASINLYNSEVGNGADPEAMLKRIHIFSRDNSRTPMQWDSSENSGFTKGTPWIKVNPNYKEINVAQSENDKDSISNYYRDMIKLRKNNLTLVYGDFEILAKDDEKVFAYLRSDESGKFLVVLNFSGDETRFSWAAGEQYKTQEMLISNYAEDVHKDVWNMQLRPFEAVVYKLA